MSKRPHTIVVGGGVIGVATAYYLAKQGSHVTLLEQGDICSGCSRGNAGQVTPGHLPLTQPGTMWRNLRWLCQSTSPLYVAPRFDLNLWRWLWRFHRACNQSHLQHATRVLCQLGAASHFLFEQLRDDIGLSYECPGRLEICRNETTYSAICAESALLRECGFQSHQLRGAEVNRFEPAIQATVAGGVYYPDSGSCNPHKLVELLAAAAMADGAEFRPNTPLSDLHIDSGRLRAVVTPDEVIEANRFVLACGSWSPQIARRIGLRLPIQPGKGYHLDIDRPVQTPAHPVVLVEERIFVTPIDDFLRLAGTMEFSGFNLTQRTTRIDQISNGAGRYLETQHLRERSRWCHLRPMTYDGLPIIDRVPHLENVWVATGHGMLGVTQGPITGKLLAEWVTENKTAYDLTPLRIGRFPRTRIPARRSTALRR